MGNDNLVKVYTKTVCQPCRFTKEFLKDKSIPFVEINVEEQPSALEELKLAGYMGVPVVAIGSLDNSWQGLRPDRLEELAEEYVYKGKYEG